MTLLLLKGGSLRAEELRIVDGLGLVRVTQEVDGPRSVTIVTRGASESEKPNLTSAQGFGRDILGQSVAGNQFLFRAVTAGIWQIRFESPHVQIVSVKVVAE